MENAAASAATSLSPGKKGGKPLLLGGESADVELPKVALCVSALARLRVTGATGMGGAHAASSGVPSSGALRCVAAAGEGARGAAAALPACSDGPRTPVRSEARARARGGDGGADARADAEDGTPGAGEAAPARGSGEQAEAEGVLETPRDAPTTKARRDVPPCETPDIPLMGPEATRDRAGAPRKLPPPVSRVTDELRRGDGHAIVRNLLKDMEAVAPNA